MGAGNSGGPGFENDGRVGGDSGAGNAGEPGDVRGNDFYEAIRAATTQKKQAKVDAKVARRTADTKVLIVVGLCRTCGSIVFYPAG